MSLSRFPIVYFQGDASAVVLSCFCPDVDVLCCLYLMCVFILVTEWPPIGQKLLTGLSICLLSIST